MPDIPEIINERQKTHGDPNINHTLMGEIDKLLSTATTRLSVASRWEVKMAMYKLTRMWTGDCRVEDHYNDTCGYVELARRREVTHSTPPKTVNIRGREVRVDCCE